ncbi:MAG: transglutaminase domain-containing protein [Candidatus Excrementavichristensenella sp.]|jgi:transglutaminase-like putative cysteine protease
MDKGRKMLNRAGAALIALSWGTAMTMMLSGAFGVPLAFGVPFLCSLLCVGLLWLGGLNRGGRVAALLLAALAMLLLCVTPFRLLQRIRELLEALVTPEVGIAMPEGAVPLIGGALAVFLTLILFWMAGMAGGVYPALTLSVILLLACWYLAGSLHGGYALMAAAALAAMFARSNDEKIGYLRAIPAAVLAAALAVAILPAGSLTWQPLYDAAQKARDLFNDYFMFTDPRTTYSISLDGFQPRGEVLGGPAQPVMAQIMEVKTDQPLLLRGSLKRTYTGYSWTENAVNSRYVMIDPTRRAIRERVFDSTRLKDLPYGKAFREARIDVTMLSEGLSTLFVPHRLTDYHAPLDLVTYFSSTGEVFITRNVQAGDAYAVEAMLPTGDANPMRSLLEKAVGAKDGGYEEARAAYLALPKGIDRKVYHLAKTLTQSIPSPYGKALALKNHLLDGYKYSLDVDYPPQGQDFVSHFLLDSKTGYCSYFASAMAVMARMVDLPSRYVEGYLVPERPGGSTTVLGKNAHAWVEIYFEGVGWLPFDPTPGSGDSYHPPRGDQPGDGGDEDPGEEPGPEEPEDPEEEPGPTPDPPATEETGEGQAQEEELPAGIEEEPEEIEDAEDAEDPEEEAEEEPRDNDQEDRPKLLWLFLLLALIALAVLLLMQRLRKSDPHRLARRRRSADDKLAVWYRALLTLLEQQGQLPNPEEAPEQFALRMAEAGITDEAFLLVAQSISMNRYAGQNVPAEAIRQARFAYERLQRQLKPFERLRWLLQRILKGPGSSAQIP